jgi:hypothetical protein
MLHAEPDALKVHLDHPIERGFRPFVGLLTDRIDLVPGDAGIVEGAIQPAESGDRRGDHGLHVGRARDVAGQGDRLAADTVDQPHRVDRRVGLIVCHRHPSSLAREGQRRFPPDAIAAACHQRDFSVEQAAHVVASICVISITHREVNFNPPLVARKGEALAGDLWSLDAGCGDTFRLVIFHYSGRWHCDAYRLAALGRLLHVSPDDLFKIVS